VNPRLLDLFCGAGGCSVGYARAGFEVVGVDIKPQPRYPFEFHLADAVTFPLDGYDAIHASPPCQVYSIATICRGKSRKNHPDLMGVIRQRLETTAVPYVIENVYGAPFRRGSVLMLCGLMFGLKVFRHRFFECSRLLWAPQHPSHHGHRIGLNGMVCVAGHGGQSSGFGQRRRWPADHRTKAAWSNGMGINWMLRDELAQAIPPAYTEYIGRQLIDRLYDGRVGENVVSRV